MSTMGCFISHSMGAWFLTQLFFINSQTLTMVWLCFERINMCQTQTSGDGETGRKVSGFIMFKSASSVIWLVARKVRCTLKADESHPCWWWGHWGCWKRAWALLSTHAPGCYAVWLAAQWSPLGEYVAHVRTAVPAAISYCESLLSPRSLGTPGEICTESSSFM